MFCEKCGKEVVLGDAFCWSCGAPIEGVTVEEEEIIESPVTEASATESPVNEVSKPEAPVTETQNMEEPKKETTQNVAPIRISPIYYKSNGVANAFRIIGWFDVILGVVGGILIIISAGSLTKSLV